MGQPVSFGIKGGVPFTGLMNGPGYSPVSNPYTLGPTIEVRLPRGLALEFDALYRHLHYSYNLETSVEFEANPPETSYNHRATAGDWDFPVLAKYRFPAKRLRPYLDGGFALDSLIGLTETTTETIFSHALLPNGTLGPSQTSTATITTSSPPELRNRNLVGLVVGAGVEVHVSLLRLSPEIRYTHLEAHFGHYSPDAGFLAPVYLLSPYTAISSNVNQAEFLLGITF